MLTRRTVLRRLHVGAGLLALVLIGLFMLTTLQAEVFGSPAEVARVKHRILLCVPALVVAMATIGATGYALSGPSPRGPVAVKIARMKIAGPNGLLILAPAAVFLAWKASMGALDAAFYAVQGLELLAGGANLVLLGLNLRDGWAMRSRRLQASLGPARSTTPPV